jgi:hypothetical protein
MASLHQSRVAEYHASMAHGGHHGGHDMFLFHGQWHVDNRDPEPPTQPDRNWGTDIEFGGNFLQMHHEMIKAADDEAKEHMNHDSIVSWYGKKGYNLPATWNPLKTIPSELAYEPDLNAFPTEIQEAIIQWASGNEMTSEAFLRRTTNTPNFLLPKYFTREGIGPDEEGEPYTGARKLADFRNINQLGCCLVYPHNDWHGSIGGAMNSFWTAIADPIFYFGVHWTIDEIFDEYKSIQSERSLFVLDRRRLSDLKSMETKDLEVQKIFTEEQARRRSRDIEISKSLRGKLTDILMNH